MSNQPPYILGTWKGYPRYQCPICPFDTLDEATALEHFRAHSERPGAKEPVEEPREEYIVIPPEALSERTQHEIAQIAADAVIEAKQTKRRRKGAKKE